MRDGKEERRADEGMKGIATICKMEGAEYRYALAASDGSAEIPED